MSELKTFQKTIEPKWLAKGAARAITVTTTTLTPSVLSGGALASMLMQTPTHIYIRFSKQEVENWQDAKGLVGAINGAIGSVIGTVAGGGIGGAIGGKLSQIVTEAIYYEISQAHKEYGKQGVILLIRTWDLLAAVGIPSSGSIINPISALRIKIGDDHLGMKRPLETIGNAHAWAEIRE